MTRARLLHAGWAAEDWGPVTPPKPGSAWCTGVQARSFIPENGSWCPPGGPPEPGPRARGWVQHLFPHLGTLKRLPARSQTDSVTQGGREARPGLAEGLRGQKGERGGRACGQRPQRHAPRPRRVTGLGSALRDAGLDRPCCPVAGTGSPAEIRTRRASLASLAAISGPAWALIGGRPHGGWPLAAYRPIAAHCADTPICGG